MSAAPASCCHLRQLVTLQVISLVGPGGSVGPGVAASPILRPLSGHPVAWRRAASPQPAGPKRPALQVVRLARLRWRAWSCRMPPIHAARASALRLVRLAPRMGSAQCTVWPAFHCLAAALQCMSWHRYCPPIVRHAAHLHHDDGCLGWELRYVRGWSGGPSAGCCRPCWGTHFTACSPSRMLDPCTSICSFPRLATFFPPSSLPPCPS